MTKAAFCLCCVLLFVLEMACTSSSAVSPSQDSRLVTVYVMAGEWTVFTEKTLLAQASAYSDWTDFQRDSSGNLSLAPQNGTIGRVIEKKKLTDDLWEIRLSKPLLQKEKLRSLKVDFLREETGGLLPSLFALKKALKNETSGQVRVALMNALSDGRFEALVEIR